MVKEPGAFFREEGELDRYPVLVIGAGVAGLTVAVNAAEMGKRVLLVDRASSHGGTITLLDKQFPTDSCGFCQILPPDPIRSEACLKSAFEHPLVRFLPSTEVEAVEGEAGNFKVTLLRKARFVDQSLCTHCGKCIEACPESYPDPLHWGMATRKAIDYRSALCSPSQIEVDVSKCTMCGACVKACPQEAIDLGRGEERLHVEVASIVLATGFVLADPSSRPELGYGKFPDVITSMELERLIAKGWAQGKREIQRPSDGSVPERVAWIQCVGSRDTKHSYCSSVCCAIALKEARMVREILPKAVLKVFYMDLRTCGKGYESYLEATKSMGVEMVRARPSEVFSRGGVLYLRVEDEMGNLREEPFDLVVLSLGMEPAKETLRLAKILGLELDHEGLVVRSPGSLSGTGREGIFVAGAACEPKDIPETVMASLEVASMVASQGTPSTLEELSPLSAVVTNPRDEDIRILVVLCDCCDTLTPLLGFEELAESLKGEKGVVEVVRESRLCRSEGLERLKGALARRKANSLVVGACTSRWLKGRKLAEMGGLDPNLVEVVNLREQTLWSHREASQEIQRSALAKLKAAVAKMRAYLPVGQSLPPRPPETRVLVVGGGPAGISASLVLASLGHEVVLVEREKELGGNLRWLSYGLREDFEPKRLLKSLLDHLRESQSVRVLTEAQVESLRGRPGHFTATIRGRDGQETIPAGAIILATGGDAVESTPYSMGHPGVMNQKDLELAMAGGRLDPKGLREVVMIQCVGSRNEEHPYCSRTCCASALKNCLRLLEGNPDLRLFVLYRDIRAFGTLERHYRKAREAGAIFVPFDPHDPPVLSQKDGALKVVFLDPTVGARLALKPDMVILNTGISPSIPNSVLESLDLELAEGGFLRERNPKFRPLDLGEGVYGCGLCLGPAFLDEAMAQGRGAGLRASQFLRGLAMRTNIWGARVNPSRCSQCGLCVETCPFGARELDTERGHAVVWGELCQACGSCVAVCPNDASQLWAQTDKQTLAAIEALLE